MKHWPKTVRFLTCDDMCRDKLNGPDGKHCLVGWQQLTFGDCMSPIGCKTYEALLSFAKERLGVDPIYLNDNRRYSLQKIANFWNDFIASLGYVEDA